MSDSGLKIVFGGATIARPPFNNQESTVELLDMLESLDIKGVDTAQIYGDSEERLGNAGAAKRFIVDTKEAGGLITEPGPTKERVIEQGHASMKRLKTDQVDIFYLHSPHPTVPIAETLAGIDALHKVGVFRRFGLSNFHPPDVEAIHAHCREHNYVLPTVYQGNYNPVARRNETSLFPTLRRLGMAFYVYSPLAGGFLTKTRAQIEDGAAGAAGSGRFTTQHAIGAMYLDLYNRPALLGALEQWEALAAAEGVSKAELAYRWVAHNSPLSARHGDAIIIGATRLEQVPQTVEGIRKGPLSQSAVEGIDKLWESIKHEAPLDNIHR